jgi:predicted dehydrogenase
MMNSLLRVAVIGCGQMGQLHAHAVASHKAAQLIGVCDINRESADTLGGHHNVPAFCNALDLLKELRPQVAIVATPDHLHRDVTLAAIDTGCHVFCEKPLAENVADARQMVDAAERATVTLAVNYNRRYGFAYQQAKQLLDNGDVGDVLHLNISVVDAEPPRAIARRDDVMLTTLLTHHFDLVWFLAGEIRAVTAHLAPPFDGLRRDVVVILDLVCGATAVVIGTYRVAQRRTTEAATLVGSLGLVKMEDVTRSVRFFQTDPDDVRILRPSLFQSGDAFSRTSHYHLHDFLDRLLRGEPPAVDGRDGLRGMQIAEVARLSYQQKTTIALDS